MLYFTYSAGRFHLEHIIFHFLHVYWIVTTDTRQDWVGFGIFFNWFVIGVCRRGWFALAPSGRSAEYWEWLGEGGSPQKGVCNTPFIVVFLPLCFLMWPPLPAQPLQCEGQHSRQPARLQNPLLSSNCCLQAVQGCVSHNVSLVP